MSEQILEKIINYGALGGVVVWFMFRFEGIIRENSKALESLTVVTEKLCSKE